MFFISKKYIVTVIIILAGVSVLAAEKAGKYEYYNPLDIGLEFGLNSGYTNNLLTDSTDIEDQFTTTSVKLKLYPVSSVEFIFFGDYTYYGKRYKLSSLSKGIGLTYIPTKQSSRLSVYLSGSFNGRTYQDDYNEYDNNNFNLMTSIGYRFGQTLSCRSGILLTSTSYLYSDTPDRDSYEIFAGTNFTVFNNNSLDIEGGYSNIDLSFIPDTTGRMNLFPPMTYADYHVKGSLRSFYISPRFSRPIGSKIGLNITFHHRRFINGDNAVVLGSALNFISPWAGIYEGQSYTINLKTTLIPRAVISAGFGYWKKTFLKTMELDSYPVYYAEKRHDEQNRLYFIIERPIYLNTGVVLKPRLLVEIANNNTTTYSMFNLYDYSSVSITGGFTCQF